MRNRAILIVEDEPLIRMDMADYLQDLGFKVFEAGNADEAIMMLQANPDIGVLFTDVDMPGSMDGLRLAEAVRDRWPPVKVLVTSGKHQLQLGALPSDCRFFSKPYRPERIVSEIEIMLAA